MSGAKEPASRAVNSLGSHLGAQSAHEVHQVRLVVLPYRTGDTRRAPMYSRCSTIHACTRAIHHLSPFVTSDAGAEEAAQRTVHRVVNEEVVRKEDDQVVHGGQDFSCFMSAFFTASGKN